jgi:hypothetical protein
MAIGCTFARRTGSTITGRTIDLGTGGMCVATTRPLSVDEVLDFELPESEPGPLMGEARVMREQAYGVYAVRFERLAGSSQTHLRELCGTEAGMGPGMTTPAEGRALENGKGALG